jgi:multidrug efflux system membrane fusion protein
LQPVTVDLTQGNISLIAKGVSEGDQVVVDGQERLQSGASVEVHSAAGPAGGPGGGAQQAGGGAGAKGGHKGAGADSVAPTGTGPDADSGKQGEHKHKKQGS